MSNQETQDLQSLCEALQKKDREIRLNAVEALGEAQDIAAIPALLKALDDGAYEVRQAVPEALAAIGKASVPGLIEALQSEKSWVRSLAAKTLGMIGDASAVQALSEALSDDWHGVRQDTAWALGMIAEPTTVPALSKAIEDGDSNVGCEAVKALGKIGDKAALYSLLDALLKEDNPDEIRESAAQALGRMRDPDAVPDLLKSTCTEGGKYHHGTMIAAWQAIEGMGEEAIPKLVQMLEDKDWDIRRAAAESLKHIGTPEALLAFEQWADNEDYRHR